MALAEFPRYPLLLGPSPVHRLDRLTEHLGGAAVWAKREDLNSGIAFGGNKTRKLEYLVADAKRKGATVLITTGSTQSNHCRQTAAAARVAGMRCVLVLNSADVEPAEQGNYLLDHLLGAEIRLVRDQSEREPGMEQAAEELRSHGEVPYVIPGGGSNPVGASAYVAAVFEIVHQLEEMGRTATRLYTTSSTSGGTHAGLSLGAKLAEAPFEIVGIAIEDDAEAIRQVVVPLANTTAAFLESEVRLAPEDLIVDDRFVGSGYAIPTRACLEAITLAARTEALLLDPVYTGKTMAGMIEHIRSGRIGTDEPVVFLHSGGTPALFAQAPAIMKATRA